MASESGGIIGEEIAGPRSNQATHLTSCREKLHRAPKGSQSDFENERFRGRISGWDGQGTDAGE